MHKLESLHKKQNQITHEMTLLLSVGNTKMKRGWD